jgi:hypothetical protein|tara:strand:+ start:308 stop:739 length:432 start_codon:yes stop_codon:yes gene_type:complete
MKQLREHIKKEIKNLMEGNYPAPPEIINALRNSLKLRPLIRYISTLKAANTVPPSYRVFFHNSQYIDLYIEQTSIVAKIGPKSYWLMNGDETSEAIKELNRLLTQPIPVKGDEETDGTTGDEGGEDTSGGADAEMEPEEEPAA